MVSKIKKGNPELLWEFVNKIICDFSQYPFHLGEENKMEMEKLIFRVDINILNTRNLMAFIYISFVENPYNNPYPIKKNTYSTLTGSKKYYHFWGDNIE